MGLSGRVGMLVPRSRPHLALVLFLLFAIIAGAVYWNEARKEIVYLCGNFSEGVSLASVTGQLNTGMYSKYRILELSTGSRVELDSSLNFGLYKCIIELDEYDRVKQAGVE